MYVYDREKAWIFTDQGQRQFLRIRDRAKGLCKLAGAVTMGAAISGESGSSWEMMACVDRLVELGELREVSERGCAGQHRLFVAEEEG